MQIVFANIGLHGTSVTRTWYYAHFAVLDGVSTIGRRFVRRTPNAVGSFNEMAGSIEALKDADIATRVSSDTAGQRLSFSLTGPTGPAAVSAIAGVHLKQIAQAGTTGPQATAGFLRIGGVNHDARPCDRAGARAKTGLFQLGAQPRRRQRLDQCHAAGRGRDPLGMSPHRSGQGHVRMPDAEFEALLARAAEEGARRALADVGLDGTRRNHCAPPSSRR